jgi:hypothetical protein
LLRNKSPRFSTITSICPAGSSDDARLAAAFSWAGSLPPMRLRGINRPPAIALTSAKSFHIANYRANQQLLSDSSQPAAASYQSGLPPSEAPPSPRQSWPCGAPGVRLALGRRPWRPPQPSPPSKHFPPPQTSLGSGFHSAWRWICPGRPAGSCFSGSGPLPAKSRQRSGRCPPSPTEGACVSH